MSSEGAGTVGKALDVLDRIAAFGRPVRFSELERSAGYPKATLYRLVRTLNDQGMLQFDPDRQAYSLGVRLVRLAHAAWQQSSLAPIARPHLDALWQKVGETVHLAQLDHGAVLYVDKRGATEPIEMFSQAGKVGPAYCTGVGKAMLAHLDEASLASVMPQQSFHRFTENTVGSVDALKVELARIRKRGFAFDREEHEPGIICISVPILTASSRVLGAMSVTTSTNRHDLAALEAWAPELKATASRISEEVASWRFPDETTNATQGTG